MITFNKKTILIIAIVLVVIALIILNVFLFLNWQAKQKEAQRQVKAAQDIQLVQNLINQKKFELLVPEKIRQQGLEPEAVALAEKGLSTIGLSPEKIKMQTDMAEILASYPMYSFEPDNRSEELLTRYPNIVADLSKMLADKTISDRQLAYKILILLGDNDLQIQEKVKPVLLASLQEVDTDTDAATLLAGALIGWGESRAIPFLIDMLDPAYETKIVLTEPALYVPVYANLTLSQYTNQSFGVAQAQWRLWWEENKDRLKWDDRKLIYIVN